MTNLLKKLFGGGEKKKAEKPSFTNKESSIDINKMLSQGGPKIMISMHAFVKFMKQIDQRWEDLFLFSGKDDRANVKCLKGFNHPFTKQAMPLLWQRKSFIENCRLFGCNYIIFEDVLTGEEAKLDIASVDESKLP